MYAMCLPYRHVDASMHKFCARQIKRMYHISNPFVGGNVPFQSCKCLSSIYWWTYRPTIKNHWTFTLVRWRAGFIFTVSKDLNAYWQIQKLVRKFWSMTESLTPSRVEILQLPHSPRSEPRAMSCRASSTLILVFAASARISNTWTASNLQPNEHSTLSTQATHHQLLSDWPTFHATMS